MNKNNVFIAIIVVLFSINILQIFVFCKNRKTIEKKETQMSYTPSFIQNIDSLLLAYIEEVNNKNCYFEICIDRKDTNLFYISFTASQYYPREVAQNPQIISEYISIHKPSYYKKEKGVNIFIYTGVEKVFKFKNIPSDLHPESKFCNEHPWTIVLKGKTIFVYKHLKVIPFVKDTFNFDVSTQFKISDPISPDTIKQW